MKEYFDVLKTKIEEAEVVLVGFGEEFECTEYLVDNEKYNRVCNQLVEYELEALLPYVNHYFLKKDERIIKALSKLESILHGKNYFIVSTCMNGMIKYCNLSKDRIVEPCGTIFKLQCQDGCKDAIFDTPEEYFELINQCIENECDWEKMKEHECGVCGKEMVFNTLYAKHYLEAGYLPMWSDYTNWLQKTVNKKLCILELGVGLKYPSVIRFPFEKMGFYNKKAYFVRVHEKLSQLTPDLKEKGFPIAVNAVEFLTDI